MASGVSNIVDHTLTKKANYRPIFIFLTVPVFPVKFFAITIEMDNLEDCLCTLYRERFERWSIIGR